MKAKTTTPKTKPVKVVAKDKRPSPAELAIAEARTWKSSVDLTLVRHGKEIVSVARVANRHTDVLFQHETEIFQNEAEIKILKESTHILRVLVAVNAAILLGVIVAVSYLICKL